LLGRQVDFSFPVSLYQDKESGGVLGQSPWRMKSTGKKV